MPQKPDVAATTSISHFQNKKKLGEKISMLTCYDYWCAKIIASTAIDCILVGDSAAMVMHGHSSTVTANIDMMKTHVEAVAKGASNKFLIGDLPFCSYRKGISHGVEMAESLIRAGAHAVKLEGAEGNLKLITHLVNSGIPVMGHLGLTPQSVNTLGGFRVQGRDEHHAEKIHNDAVQLENAGCFAVVLECIPRQLAKHITRTLSIATIGIGAGPDTDGQVLVLQDMLGVNPSFKPKFLQQYLNGFDLIKQALENYHQAVIENKFPEDKHSF